jgi:hypothetical protein
LEQAGGGIPLPVENAAKSHIMNIAGIKLSFFGDSLHENSHWEVPSKPRAGDEVDDIVIRLHGGTPGTEFSAARYVFHSLWTLSQSGDKYIFREGSQESDAPPNKVLILGTDLREGDLYVPDGPSNPPPLPDPLGYPLNQVLMILILSRRNGILVHACGIDDNGSGCLFLGNSGHGKSTMAKLWCEHHATVLNDDRIVVREREGKIWMYGTPWHGDFRDFSPAGLPIGKIFFLHPDRENSVIPQNGAKAVAMLLTRSFPPLWDREGMALTVDFCHRLAKSIPCYDLHFRRDQTVIDCVRSAS